MFVPNFKILGQVVTEKSLTKKVYTHTYTQTELELMFMKHYASQQMLVHKGGKIKNWGGECRDVTPTKSMSQNIRVDVNREVKFL